MLNFLLGLLATVGATAFFASVVRHKIATGRWSFRGVLWTLVGIGLIVRSAAQPRSTLLVEHGSEDVQTYFFLPIFETQWELIGAICTALPLLWIATGMAMWRRSLFLHSLEFTRSRRWLSLLIGTVVLTGFVAVHPDLSHRILLTFVVMWCLTDDYTSEQLGLLIHGSLLWIASFCCLSLIVGMFSLPGAWAGNGTTSSLTSDRLQGLATHPNSLGFITAIGVTLALLPSKKTVLTRILLSLPILVTMALTLSKTSILSAILAGLLIKRISSVWLITGGVMAFLLINDTVVDQIFALLGTDVTTASKLTGRSDFWSTILAQWQEWWIFGYGVGFLGIEHRTALNLPDWAGQAHNQFLQSFGQSGIFGIASTLLFLMVVGMRAMRLHFLRISSAAFALFIIIFLRCFAETPLRINSLDNYAAGIALLLAACSVALPRKKIGRTSIRTNHLPQSPLNSASPKVNQLSTPPKPQ